MLSRVGRQGFVRFRAFDFSNAVIVVFGGVERKVYLPVDRRKAKQSINRNDDDARDELCVRGDVDERERRASWVVAFARTWVGETEDDDDDDASKD